MLVRACNQLVTSKASPDQCVRCEHPVSAHNRQALEPKSRTTKIFGDTIKAELCRSPSCRKQIYFAQAVKTEKWIPFDVRPVAISKSTEIETTREIWLVELTGNHFATCVSARAFRSRR